MREMLRAVWRDESGQGLTEYVLIIALVAIGLTAVMLLFRDSIGDVFTAIKAKLDAAPSGDYTAPAGG